MSGKSVSGAFIVSVRSLTFFQVSFLRVRFFKWYRTVPTCSQYEPDIMLPTRKIKSDFSVFRIRVFSGSGIDFSESGSGWPKIRIRSGKNPDP